MPVRLMAGPVEAGLGLGLLAQVGEKLAAALLQGLRGLLGGGGRAPLGHPFLTQLFCGGFGRFTQPAESPTSLYS